MRREERSEDPAVKAAALASKSSALNRRLSKKRERQRLARWRKDGRLPFEARVESFFRRHSPMEWLRLNVFRSETIPELALDWRSALRALEAVLWPIFAIHLFQVSTMMFAKAVYVMAGVQSASTASLPVWFQTPTIGKLLLPYMVSPWTVYHLHHFVQPVFKMSSQAGSFTRGTKSKTLPDAWAALSEAKEFNAVYRTPRYDVFLPHSLTQPTPVEVLEPTNATETTAPKTPQGACSITTPPRIAPLRYIMMLPGAGVEHTAYAQPAKLFSDFGYTVVTVSGEPWRMVTPEMGFDSEYLKSIMDEVEDDIAERLPRSKHQMDCNSDGPDEELFEGPSPPESRWFLVGHSLGCFTGIRVGGELGTAAVAMWGAAPFINFMPDWSNSTCRTPSACIPPTVVIQGSNDAVVEAVGSPEAYEIFWQRLPDGTREYVIASGTHKGFAHYLSKNPKFQELAPAGAHPESVSKQQFYQQKQAVEITHQFFHEITTEPKRRKKKRS